MQGIPLSPSPSERTTSGPITNAETVGKALADKLIAKGADKILAALEHVK